MRRWRQFSSNNNFYAVAALDGGDIAAGGYHQDGSGPIVPMMSRWNAEGDLIWAREVTFSGRNSRIESLIAANSHIYTAHFEWTYNVNNDDVVYVAKWTLDGALIAYRTFYYAGGGANLGYEVSPLSNGDLVVTGGTRKGAPSSPDFDVFLLRLDADLSLQYQKLYDAGGADYGLWPCYCGKRRR